MTTKTVALKGKSAREVLVKPGAVKDVRHRIGAFADRLDECGRTWRDPDLAAYRDHLARSLSPASVAAHLSTVRGVYRALMRDNDVRRALASEARAELRAQGERVTAADVKALVDEQVTRIENAIDPRTATVEVVKSQDRPDDAHVRLTRAQAEALLRAPNVVPLAALRDTAAIALMLCTGIREAELCALEVRDLRQRLGGELALHVRRGKGAKERLIPYGELSWVLAIVDKWLLAAGITVGPVMRSLWKGGARIRGALSVRAVENIVASYPVMNGDGEPVTVHPHDLRRTYARRLYEAGVDLVAIQQNLGHADLKTTLGYIGKLDADKRRAKLVYTFDLAALRDV